MQKTRIVKPDEPFVFLGQLIEGVEGIEEE